MFGIPIDEGYATNILCDNQSVVNISINIEYVLTKKDISIAYHYTRWNVTAGVLSIAWINGIENLADPFTKILPAAVREYLFGNWAY